MVGCVRWQKRSPFWVAGDVFRNGGVLPAGAFHCHNLLGSHLLATCPEQYDHRQDQRDSHNTLRQDVDFDHLAWKATCPLASKANRVFQAYGKVFQMHAVRFRPHAADGERPL
jgi:hypothetical protein